MLRINRETDYAIRVILALAELPRGEVIPSAVIRKEMHLPEALSLQIISRLSNLDLINTYPGRKGGIELAHPPAEISLLEVIQAMEGPIIVSDCLQDGHECVLAPECPVQRYWIELQGRIEQDLGRVNFQQLAAGKTAALDQVVQ